MSNRIGELVDKGQLSGLTLQQVQSRERIHMDQTTNNELYEVQQAMFKKLNNMKRLMAEAKITCGNPEAGVEMYQARDDLELTMRTNNFIIKRTYSRIGEISGLTLQDAQSRERLHMDQATNNELYEVQQEMFKKLNNMKRLMVEARIIFGNLEAAIEMYQVRDDLELTMRTNNHIIKRAYSRVETIEMENTEKC